MQIAKAQPIGNQEIPSRTIHFKWNCPDFESHDEPVSESLKRADAFFTQQAKDLEQVLHDTLPGGTYDRLLRMMLQRRASHFVVPFTVFDGKEPHGKDQ